MARTNEAVAAALYPRADALRRFPREASLFDPSSLLAQRSDVDVSWTKCGIAGQKS
jgi:hypothetical protein